MRKIKLKYLEMFLAAMDFYDQHLFSEITYTIDIYQLLKNPEFKVMALHIINRALPLITVPEVLTLNSKVVALIDDASNEVREIVYEILIYIYKNLAGQIGLEELERIGTLLLEGILDTDPDIQGSLIKLWSDPDQLPGALDQRMERLFYKIYKKEARNFLTTAAILLLQPAIVDPVSALPLFHYTPGADVRHIERKIDTHWRRNASLTRPPLFVETKALKQSIMTLSTQFDGIRATLPEEGMDTVPFTPTVDPNTFFTSRNMFRSNIVTQESLFVSTQSTALSRRSNIIESQEMSTQQQTGYNHLRQRFLKGQPLYGRLLKASNYSRNNELRQRTARQEQTMKVTLYRRYRDGDFPDLNINSLAILLPLQALLRHDKQITRQVFNELFEASLKIGKARELSLYTEKIGLSTNMIMNSFVSGDPTFVATLLNIAIQNAKLFEIEPKTVKNVAKATNNISLGILYLEERLNLINTSQPYVVWSSPKSERVYAEDHWVQMAELYRCLSEHDHLNVIFANKIKVDPRVPKAISAISEHRFDRADDIWVKILESIVKDKPELDFCYEGHYNCLAALAQWGELEQNVNQQFSSMDEVRFIFKTC